MGVARIFYGGGGAENLHRNLCSSHLQLFLLITISNSGQHSNFLQNAFIPFLLLFDIFPCFIRFYFFLKIQREGNISALPQSPPPPPRLH
jgi:hypothetical protein